MKSNTLSLKATLAVHQNTSNIHIMNLEAGKMEPLKGQHKVVSCGPDTDPETLNMTLLKLMKKNLQEKPVVVMAMGLGNEGAIQERMPALLDMIAEKHKDAVILVSNPVPENIKNNPQKRLVASMKEEAAQLVMQCGARGLDAVGLCIGLQANKKERQETIQSVIETAKRYLKPQEMALV